MALDLGTLVAKVRVDDDDFDKKTNGWSAKGAAVASAFGNVAADAISQAAGMLQGWVSEAVEASDATDKFKQSLSFAGLDTSTIDSLAKSTKVYADETIYSLTDVMGITSQLAANGVKDYDTLAMSLGNLNAASSGNAETYSRLGSVLTQTAGAGKLTTENWNQLADAIPGASGMLQDALLQAGAYTGNFREAMEKGEISADEFNAAITLLGQNQGAVDAAKNTETFEGSIGSFQAGVVSLITQVLNELKPAFVAVMSVMSGVVEWVSANADWLGPLALGIGIVATAVGIWTVAQWLLNAALTANPIGLIIVAIGLLIGAVILLVQHWDEVVAWLTEIWQGFCDWIVGIVEGLAAWWNGIWAAFGQWITSVWEGFTGFVSDVFRNFQLGLMIVGNAIASWWNGLWSGIGSFFTDLWNNIVNFVMGVIQGYVSFVMGIFNSFLGFWNGLWTNVGNFFRTTWEGALAFVRGIPQAIFDVFTGAATWLYDIGKNIVQGLWNGLKSIWESVSSWFQDTFGGIIDTVAGIFGIHSPSRVFSEFGVFIGEGLIEGLAKIQPDVENAFTDMERVPSTGGWNSAGGGSGDTINNSKSVTYIAAENQALDSEEALYAALGSPRVRD